MKAAQEAATLTRLNAAVEGCQDSIRTFSPQKGSSIRIARVWIFREHEDSQTWGLRESGSVKRVFLVIWALNQNQETIKNSVP